MSQATQGSEPFQNSKLFSSYYLSDRIEDLDAWDCDEAAQDAFERLQNLWELERDLVDGYNEDALLDSWIDKVIEVLGFDSLPETTLPDGGGYTDRLLFESADTRRDAAQRKNDGDQEAVFGLASAVLEAKQWGADFTTKFDEQRSYRDASHQIKYYLERTPERLQWGILTNGRKWRLYGTKDYATEIYYEVDLPELLTSGEIEQFKYFFTFFRREAFQEVGGTSFLDTVWSESETAAQQLGEDLQDNVFTALRVLGEGFIETNDLDIDPDDAEARAELKEQSLVLLYRLMFVLYAESRGLIHPDEPTKQVEYEEHFSLEQQLLEIHNDITSGDSYADFSGYSTGLWGRLEDLFSLIDEGEADLGIPPYNGGLFDASTHEFLAEHEVADRYLAEVIHRLGTTEGDDGTPAVADYGDLDTRHLGSIYEGLLEHEFRIAPEQYAAVSQDGGEVWKPATEVSVADAVETVEAGGLYVVNDDGERKATGAYYTPDYVVSYIVEETIDPLIAEIKTELADEGLLPGDKGYFGGFYSRVLQLKVLDPAMGSAHFLTSATAYLTDQVMEIAREQEDQGRDEQEIRRTIAKECIYGVDINGMAVELGKLSMWLETLAADKPLAFLDHHLKAGNSLVGSDITEVLADDSNNGGGQLTLSQSFARARQQTLGHVMELMQDLLAIDNDALVDIKSMEELYDEIRDDPLYIRLFEIANVHTAEQFGVDVPEGVYEDMAAAIDDVDAWDEIQGEDWFTSAQALASEQSFFHWELEYPEVFFNVDGEKMAEAGFDAVIGNPPYVKIQNLNEQNKAYFYTRYEVSEERYDLYGLFLERAYSVSNRRTGFITPNKFFESSAGESLRRFLSNSNIVSEIIDLNESQVFTQASIYTCLLFLEKGRSESDIRYKSIHEDPEQNIRTAEWLMTELSKDGDKWALVSPDQKRILEKVETEGVEFNDVAKHIFVGIQTSANDVFVLQDCETIGKEIRGYSKSLDQCVTIESEITRPYVEGQNMSRYSSLDSDLRLLYPYSDDADILPEENLKQNYPQAYNYLKKNKSELEDRGGEGDEFDTWYAHWRQRHPETFERSKIIVAQIVNQGQATYDYSGEVYFSNMLYSPGVNEKYKSHDFSVLGILNSTLIWHYISQTGSVLRGGYYRYTSDYLSPINLPLNKDVSELDQLVEDLLEYYSKYNELNTNLMDHLGAYDDGPTLSEIGLTQPPRGSADSILQQTATEKPNLRVGTASVDRESSNTVEIRLTARYKPSEDDAVDESEFEVDQWGYTETDPQAALRITDLTETEADLIEAFVPVAVDEAGGFAGFRETATKTNSLVDRLRKLTLPRVADVEAGLAGYLETKERAEELDAKIESTDALIDEIVYELYGLTDEEIEIVEEAVGE